MERSLGMTLLDVMMETSGTLQCLLCVLHAGALVVPALSECGNITQLLQSLKKCQIFSESTCSMLDGDKNNILISVSVLSVDC